MAVKIRLARHGAKKHPYYRVVVADSRRARDGKFIEDIGRYNPCADPTFVKFDQERLDYWLGVGAQPTDTVEHLIKTYSASAEKAASSDKEPAKPAGKKAKAAPKAKAE